MPRLLKPPLLLLVLHTSFILCLITYLSGCQRRSRFLTESILCPPSSFPDHRTNFVKFHFRVLPLNKPLLTVLWRRGLVIHALSLIRIQYLLTGS